MRYLVALLIFSSVLCVPIFFGCASNNNATPSAPSPVTVYACSQQGYTISGPVTNAVPSGYLQACAVTLSVPTTAFSMSAYVYGPASGQLQMGVYTDNATYPQSLIGQTSPQSVTAPAWNTINLPASTTLAAGKYWLVLEDSGGVSMTYSSTGGNHYYVSYAFGSLPASFPGGALNNSFNLSLYTSTCP